MAIEVNNVSKTYVLWRTPLSRLLVPLAFRLIRPFAPNRFARFEGLHCQAVEALTDVSFSIEKGDSLGIVGLNGSGKSTLLQIIAGTLQPTRGSISVQGRVAALLELGSGFNPEFSGRENVYLNAAILGLTKKEVDARYQSIVEFANIGDFIHRPVKTYSSGMMMRLAFAVQVHVEPDVLIVDEALAVGDAQFKAKALTKIDEILEKGTTLLFVGHDQNAVKAFCRRAMIMHQGKIVSEGTPDEINREYMRLVNQYKASQESKASGNKAVTIEKRIDGFGVPGVKIDLAKFVGRQGQHTKVGYGDLLDIFARATISTDMARPQLIVELIDVKGLQVAGKRIDLPAEKDKIAVRLKLQCTLQKGIYRIRMRLVDAPVIDRTTVYARHDDVLSIEQVDDMRDHFIGLFPLPLSCDIDRLFY